MKIKGLYGKEIYVNIRKYRIDWSIAPSKQQQILQDFLFPYLKNHIVLSEFRIPQSKLRIDILDLSYKHAYEYSPISHHGTYNEFFHHSRSGYLGSIKRDVMKIEWLEKNNFKYIEINEEDLDCLSREYFKNKFDIIL